MTRVYFITGTIVFPNEMNLHQPPWQYKSHKKELNESQKCEKLRELREEGEATADGCDHRRVEITDWKNMIFEFTASCIPESGEMWMRWAQSEFPIGMCPGSSMLVNGFYWANFELDLCGRRALFRPTLCAANRAHLTIMKISPCPGRKALEISFHGEIKRDARDKFESWPL